MAAGMKDVATLAGVAVGTVSNVLNRPDIVAEPLATHGAVAELVAARYAAVLADRTSVA